MERRQGGSQRGGRGVEGVTVTSERYTYAKVIPRHLRKPTYISPSSYPNPTCSASSIPPTHLKPTSSPANTPPAYQNPTCPPVDMPSTHLNPDRREAPAECYDETAVDSSCQTVTDQKAGGQQPFADPHQPALWMSDNITGTERTEGEQPASRECPRTRRLRSHSDGQAGALRRLIQQHSMQSCPMIYCSKDGEREKQPTLTENCPYLSFEDSDDDSPANIFGGKGRGKDDGYCILKQDSMGFIPDCPTLGTSCVEFIDKRRWTSERCRNKEEWCPFNLQGHYQRSEDIEQVHDIQEAHAMHTADINKEQQETEPPSAEADGMTQKGRQSDQLSAASPADFLFQGPGASAMTLEEACQLVFPSGTRGHRQTKSRDAAEEGQIDTEPDKYTLAAHLLVSDRAVLSDDEDDGQSGVQSDAEMSASPRTGAMPDTNEAGTEGLVTSRDRRGEDVVQQPDGVQDDLTSVTSQHSDSGGGGRGQPDTSPPQPSVSQLGDECLAVSILMTCSACLQPCTEVGVMQCFHLLCSTCMIPCDVDNVECRLCRAQQPLPQNGVPLLRDLFPGLFDLLHSHWKILSVPPVHSAQQCPEHQLTFKESASECTSGKSKGKKENDHHPCFFPKQDKNTCGRADEDGEETSTATSVKDFLQMTIPGYTDQTVLECSNQIVLEDRDQPLALDSVVDQSGQALPATLAAWTRSMMWDTKTGGSISDDFSTPSLSSSTDSVCGEETTPANRDSLGCSLDTTPRKDSSKDYDVTTPTYSSKDYDVTTPMDSSKNYDVTTLMNRSKDYNVTTPMKDSSKDNDVTKAMKDSTKGHDITTLMKESCKGYDVTTATPDSIKDYDVTIAMKDSRKGDDVTQLCGACHTRADVQYVCVTCGGIGLCASCHVAHLNLPVTRCHELVRAPLSLSPLSPLTLLSHHQPLCMHHGQDLALQCCTCSQLLCHRCVTPQHVQHEIRELGQLKYSSHKHFSRLQRAVKQHVLTAKSSRRALSQQLNKVKVTQQQVTKAIQHNAIRHLQRLMTQAQQLTRALHTTTQPVLQQLTATLSDVLHVQGEGEKLRCLLNAVRDDTPHLTQLILQHTCQVWFDQLRQHRSLQVGEVDSVVFRPNLFLDDQLATAPILGSVCTLVTGVSDTTMRVKAVFHTAGEVSALATTPYKEVVSICSPAHICQVWHRNGDMLCNISRHVTQPREVKVTPSGVMVILGRDIKQAGGKAAVSFLSPFGSVLATVPLSSPLLHTHMDCSTRSRLLVSDGVQRSVTLYALDLLAKPPQLTVLRHVCHSILYSPRHVTITLTGDWLVNDQDYFMRVVSPEGHVTTVLTEDEPEAVLQPPRTSLLTCCRRSLASVGCDSRGRMLAVDSGKNGLYILTSGSVGHGERHFVSLEELTPSCYVTAMAVDEDDVILGMSDGTICILTIGLDERDSFDAGNN